MLILNMGWDEKAGAKREFMSIASKASAARPGLEAISVRKLTERESHPLRGLRVRSRDIPLFLTNLCKCV